MEHIQNIIFPKILFESQHIVFSLVKQILPKLIQFHTKKKIVTNIVMYAKIHAYYILNYYVYI